MVSRRRAFPTSRARVVVLSTIVTAAGFAACTYSLAEVRPGENPSSDAALGPDVTSDGGRPLSDASAPNVACPPDANLGPYVLTDDSTLYRFDPSTLAFTKIGKLGCDAGEPWDMAVDQSGTAWVVFFDGGLASVDTTNAHCTSASGYEAGQDGFLLYAMAYARPSLDAGETLYLSDTTYRQVPGPGSHGLATLDALLRVHPIGKFQGIPNVGAELSGTSNGTLYAFFPDDDAGNPATISSLVFMDGSVGLSPNSSVLSGLHVPRLGDFAFIYWRSAFYMFVAADQDPASTVWSYRGASTFVVDASAPGRIIGAAVSSCAPAY